MNRNLQTTTERPLRVMIVDDHALVRAGLSAVLQVYDDLELVAEAASGDEALRLCEQHQPDVILMDLVMPGMDGADTTHTVRERWPQVQVIALTSFKDREWVVKALQAGAVGYVLKDASDSKLANAIRAASAGQAILAPEATQVLVEAIHTAQQEPRPTHGLTAREFEVLALLVEGATNPDIADRLSISRSTTAAHVSSILSKLDVSNRAEAVALAIRTGLLA